MVTPLKKWPPPAAKHEPAPIKNQHPAITDLVVQDLSTLYADGHDADGLHEDLLERRAVGIKKYGTPLQPFNGRNALMDLYQELLDGVNYARQVLFEIPVRQTPPVIGGIMTMLRAREANNIGGIYRDLIKLAVRVRAMLDLRGSP